MYPGQVPPDCPHMFETPQTVEDRQAAVGSN